MPFGRDQIVRQTTALGNAFAQAGSPTVLTMTDFAPAYADAPQGIADSPWELPKADLPANFATLVPRNQRASSGCPHHKAADERVLWLRTHLQLRRRGCETVVICGVATNMGVEATARAAFDLNYNVVLIPDACGSIAPGWHEFAMEKILPRIARVKQTSEILQALKRHARRKELLAKELRSVHRKGDEPG